MITSLILALIISPATADAPADCEGVVWPHFASDFGEVPLPIDGAIPVLLMSECGGSGETEVILHRVVDDELAEATAITNTYVELRGWQIVTLESDTQLLEDSDYAIVVNERTYHFTTGSETAQGMGSEAPSLELWDMQAYGQGTDTYDLWLIFTITPSEDLDGLSYVEIFNSDIPDTPLMAFIPGNASEVPNARLSYETDNTDEACFFAVQTDGLGNVSDPSMETCMTPQLDSDDDDGWWCSSSGSLPTLWTSLLALGAAMFRRQRR